MIKEKDAFLLREWTISLTMTLFFIIIPLHTLVRSSMNAHLLRKETHNFKHLGQINE